MLENGFVLKTFTCILHHVLPFLFDPKNFCKCCNIVLTWQLLISRRLPNDIIGCSIKYIVQVEKH